ncbi:MAG: hypothetical protein V4515_09880 [Chloroflexota bacterium]
MSGNGPLDGHDLEAALLVEALEGWNDVPLRCATCGTELVDLDPEDEPDGDAGLPICGECNRARNFDVFGRDEG